VLPRSPVGLGVAQAHMAGEFRGVSTRRGRLLAYPTNTPQSKTNVKARLAP
jgi:hypothetical protein